MLILMEQTINYMGTFNHNYTQELVNQAQSTNEVVMIMDKDGKSKGAYIRVPDIDRKKFGKKKDRV